MLCLYRRLLAAFCWALSACLAALQVQGAGDPAPAPADAPAFDWRGISDADMFALLDLEQPGLEAVKASVAQGDFEAAKAAFLQWRRAGSKVRWRTAPLSPRATASATNREADDICNHIIHNDYHTFQPPIKTIFMGEDFDWDHNPVAEGEPNFTHEFTWSVISRMYFWNTLAGAYASTRNEKYAQKWVWFLNDFSQDNPLDDFSEPPGQTLLWRTIDAGLRMNSAWPNAYFTFLNSPSFTAQDHWLFYKLAYAHALRLQDGLLRGPERKGNWVNFECRGLYNIGVLFPEFRDAVSWRTMATDRLLAEMNLSLTPEGMQAELSPSYHYGALESWRTVFDVAKLNELSVPEVFVSRLADMYRAPLLVMDQAGRSVVTNDSLEVDLRKKAEEGLEIVDDPVLRWVASGGREGEAVATSSAIEHAGFYAMRSGWQADDVYLFFRGGPAGIGHAEQDMLQVVLKAWGQTLLPDPGKYPYDRSDWRRFATNSPSHNTVIVDGKWQHRRESKPPLDTLPDNPWVTTGLFDFVAATYSEGYQKNEYDPTRQYRPQKWVGSRDRSVSHTRRILFLKPAYALVLDSLDGRGRHTFDAHFHLNTQSAQLDSGTNAVVGQRDDGIGIALFPLNADNLSVEIIKGQKDPLLGWLPAQHQPIPTVRFRKVQQAPAAFSTLLYPYKADTPSLSAQPLAVTTQGAATLWSGSLQSQDETVEYVIAGKGNQPERFSFASALVGNVVADAAGLVLRQPLAGNHIAAGGWAMRSYRDTRVDFIAQPPATLNFIEQKNSNTIIMLNAGTAAVSLTFAAPLHQQTTLEPGQSIRITPGRIEPFPETPSDFSSLISPAPATKPETDI